MNELNQGKKIMQHNRLDMIEAKMVRENQRSSKKGLSMDKERTFSLAQIQLRSTKSKYASRKSSINGGGDNILNTYGNDTMPENETDRRLDMID